MNFMLYNVTAPPMYTPPGSFKLENWIFYDKKITRRIVEADAISR